MTQQDSDESHHRSKYYVITEDLEAVLQPWAQRHGFTLPTREFLNSLRKEMGRFLSNTLSRVHRCHVKVLTIPYTNLYLKAKNRIKALNVDYPKLSLDPIYFPYADFFLQMCRSIVYNGNPQAAYKTILTQRSGFPPLRFQAQNVAAAGARKVVVLDDGYWSGETRQAVVRLLHKAGISIVKYCVGIKINKKRNPSDNIHVLCKEIDQPIDWVCERDFFPGVPLSGRSLIYKGKLTECGMAYLTIPSKPEMGNGKWASIGPGDLGEEESAAASEFFIRMTMRLFEEIERRSRKPVLWKHIGRKPFGIQGAKNDHYLALLESQMLKQCQIHAAPFS